MKLITTSLLSATLALTSVHASTVVIDNFGSTAPASILDIPKDTSTNNTFAASGVAIGGYRTMSLSSTNGGSSSRTQFILEDGSLTLSTPNLATANFSITWGGAGGVAGLGGVNLVGTSTNLADSSLNFMLLSTDANSSYTWTFVDTSSASATYTGGFLVTSTNTPISLSLDSFSGAINWKSINFISLSGGGVVSMDLSLGQTALRVETVPEPSTYAMLAMSALALAIYMIRRRQHA